MTARVLFAFWLLLGSLVLSPVSYGEPEHTHHSRAELVDESGQVIPMAVVPETGPVRRAIARGMTLIRVHLFANDEEWVHVMEAREEAHHALEHPTTFDESSVPLRNIPDFNLSTREVVPAPAWVQKTVHWLETFGRSKGALLSNPKGALDMRRSFENVARLMRLSKDFKSPWLRNLLVSVGTMFAMTHGSEFTAGVTMAAVELARAAFTFDTHHLLLAAGWGGLALPGLYDFGCWIGAGVLIVRPTRMGFQKMQTVMISAAGKAAESLEMPALMQAIFTHQSARERIKAAAVRAETAGAQMIEFEIPDDELMTIDLYSTSGTIAVRMHLEENERKEVVLREAIIDPKAFAEKQDIETEINLTRYTMLGDQPMTEAQRRINARILAGAARVVQAIPDPEKQTTNVRVRSNKDPLAELDALGWNVKGALRQIRKLIRRGQTELIGHEETFVENVSTLSDGRLAVQFRGNAVTIQPKRLMRPWEEVERNCAQWLKDVEAKSVEASRKRHEEAFSVPR